MFHQEYRGKRLLVYYKGGAKGEEPVEDHFDGQPEEIVLGAGLVPPGVDEVLYDMEIGECRTAIIPCEKAYGQHDPEGVRTYPKMMLPHMESIEEGDLIWWTHPVSGVDVPVKVISVTDYAVVIDFNHLLAGKDLEYCFKLIDVIDHEGNSIL